MQNKDTTTSFISRSFSFGTTQSPSGSGLSKPIDIFAYYEQWKDLLDRVEGKIETTIANTDPDETNYNVLDYLRHRYNVVRKVRSSFDVLVKNQLMTRGPDAGVSILNWAQSEFLRRLNAAMVEKKPQKESQAQMFSTMNEVACSPKESIIETPNESPQSPTIQQQTRSLLAKLSTDKTNEDKNSQQQTSSVLSKIPSIKTSQDSNNDMHNQTISVLSQFATDKGMRNNNSSGPFFNVSRRSLNSSNMEELKKRWARREENLRLKRNELRKERLLYTQPVPIPPTEFDRERLAQRISVIKEREEKMVDTLRSVGTIRKLIASVGAEQQKVAEMSRSMLRKGELLSLMFVSISLFAYN